MSLPCRACSLHNNVEIRKPLEAFASRSRSKKESLNDILSVCEDLNCMCCRRLRFKERGLMETRMLCDCCYKSLPRSCFAEADSVALRKGEIKTYHCLQCTDESMGKERKGMEVLECRKCELKWPEHH